jgi:hypothetical protein
VRKAWHREVKLTMEVKTYLSVLFNTEEAPVGVDIWLFPRDGPVNLLSIH